MSLPPLPEPGIEGLGERWYTAAQLREAQRAVAEECAKLIIENTPKDQSGIWDAAYRAVAEDMASAIRAKFCAKGE